MAKPPPSERFRKPHLPTKSCQVCGRSFAWRRKWVRDWDEVKFCSERCRGDSKKRKPAAGP